MKNLVSSLFKLTASSALLIPALASAHSSILEKEVHASVMTDHSASYLTIQVPHGCKDEADNHYPTKGIVIRFPNSDADIASGTFFANATPVSSYYGIRTKTEKRMITVGEEVQELDQVTELAIVDINIPYGATFKAEFKGKPILKEGEVSGELKFDIIQYCPNGTIAEWSVANGKAAHITVVPAAESSHH